MNSITNNSKFVTFIPQYNMKVLTIIIRKYEDDRNKYVERNKRRLTMLLFAKHICKVKPLRPINLTLNSCNGEADVTSGNFVVFPTVINS
jgi:hypothetical protein